MDDMEWALEMLEMRDHQELLRLCEMLWYRGESMAEGLTGYVWCIWQWEEFQKVGGEGWVCPFLKGRMLKVNVKTRWTSFFSSRSQMYGRVMIKADRDNDMWAKNRVILETVVVVEVKHLPWENWLRRLKWSLFVAYCNCVLYRWHHFNGVSHTTDTISGGPWLWCRQ